MTVRRWERSWARGAGERDSDEGFDEALCRELEGGDVSAVAASEGADGGADWGAGLAGGLGGVDAHCWVVGGHAASEWAAAEDPLKAI